ncbi:MULTISPECIES: hypothetical protein [Culturomica]|uniref:hypothetical protein n=1 Tax=Culturomica TaxID=1926651 RepID=UPI000E8513CF|nr:MULTISPECIES: hypothetical protein [Culturomica]HBO26844.1 hypothetical protein [Culturomica sp.]
MKRYFSVLLMLLCAHLLSAQSLVINGYIVIDDDSSEGARITIHKNNEKLEEKNISKKGKFDLKFGWDADYKLSFEKPGYITKIVSINTDVPPEIVETNPNFPPVKLIINLLPQVEGVDLSIFEQPIAILSYNHELDDFIFDKEYSSKIKDKIAQTEQKVRTELAQRGAAAREKERLFAEWCNKGQAHFAAQKWQDAIEAWSEALKIKTDAQEVKEKIEIARKESELEAARKAVEAQNERNYQLLISSADSLFRLQNYNPAREKYVAARTIKSAESYPIRQIEEIDKLLTQLAQAEKAAAEQKALQEKYKGLIATADLSMQQKNYDEAELKYKEALALNFEKEYPENQLKSIAEIRKQEAEQQRIETELNNKYGKIIAEADNHFASKTYDKALEGYRQAGLIKPAEAYPKEMITKTENAIALQEQQIAAEAEKRRQEEQRKAALMDKYNKIITDADAAFKSENYAIARTRYTEAVQLNTGLSYPQDQIKAIDGIVNSTKYQQKLTEYKKNKEMAEKAAAAKNYASAKFYYQKARDILPIDKDDIEKHIAEIDQLIEAERLATIEKEYKKQIEKADQAYKDKSYAIAKFYYQKALEVKENDQYAKERLAEVEKNIGERTEKTLEL